MKKLEFKNLLSRFHVEAPKDEAADHFELADTREKAEKFLEKAAKAESLALPGSRKRIRFTVWPSLSVMRERLFFWRREALTKMAWRLIS